MASNSQSKVAEDKKSSDVLSSIHNFRVERVLDVDPRLKSAAVCGHVGGDSDIPAVAVFHKEPLDAAKLQEAFSENVTWAAFLENDIYGGFIIKNPPESLSAIKATFIYPATEKHIAKYTRQDFYMCVETPEIYTKIVRPHFESMRFSIQWVYNILEHKTESERIVFEDKDPENGFILLPDLKWTGEKSEELYLMGIVHRRDLKSLRDLRGEHVSLLTNILEKAQETAKKRYGVPKSKLKIFVHYHPTYQHFHVHILHLNMEGFGSGIERGHLLSTVISNLKIDSDFYVKADLPITVRHDDPLRGLLEEAGVLEI